jgi:hypothetical protein
VRREVYIMEAGYAKEPAKRKEGRQEREAAEAKIMR